jgi:APA family basic amino acid/polyamine antiporter
MAMSRDRFLPSAFSKLHDKLQTPHIGTIACGCVAALVAGFYPIAILGNVSSFLILSILMIVVAAAMWLRVTRPELRRPFKCPGLLVIGTIAMFS